MSDEPSSKKTVTPGSRKSRQSADPAALTRTQLALIGEILKETARHYVARLQREIDELSALLEARQVGRGFSRSEMADLKKMQQLIAQLNVNPGKGRRKDLKKIDATIGDLQAAFEKW